MFEPISLDAGFGNTKVASPSESIIIPSVTGEPIDTYQGDLAKKRKDDIVASVNNRKLFVGNLAIRQSPARYYSLDENKPDDETTKFVALTGIAMVAQRDTCRVVNALPVDHYFTSLKEEAEKFLLGKYSVCVNGNTRSICIEKCKTTMQGLEVIFDQILDDGGNATSKWAMQTIAAVDIGFYTTNLIVLNKMEPVKKLCKSIPVGISNAWKMLTDFLYHEKGIDIKIYEVDNLVEEKVININGIDYDLSEPIAKALAATAAEINGEIKTRWPQRPFSRILGAGGGMERIGQSILPGELTVVDQPQLANVRGGLKIARREATWRTNT